MNDYKAETAYAAMYSDYPDVVTVNDIRKMLGLSRDEVYQLIHNGTLKRIGKGRAFLIPKLSVINYVLQSAQESDENPV